MRTVPRTHLGSEYEERFYMSGVDRIRAQMTCASLCKNHGRSCAASSLSMMEDAQFFTCTIHSSLQLSPISDENSLSFYQVCPEGMLNVMIWKD